MSGCCLRCPWCCNPEYLERKDKDVDLDGLISLLLRDRRYYGKDGGITFSGGECLLSLAELKPLLIALKKEGINIAVETSLCSSPKALEEVSEYIDHFLVDFKIMNAEKAKAALGANMKIFLANLEYLKSQGRMADVLARIPLAKEYSFTKENISDIVGVFAKYGVSRCELLPIHNLAKSKYDELGLGFQEFASPSKEELIALRQELQGHGIDTKALSI